MARPHRDDDDGSADSCEGVFASPADRVAALLDLCTSVTDEAVGGPVDGEARPDVPGYEIVARLGEGGMGTVWRAVQRSTRREVALKLVGHGAAVGSHRARLRFDREVELAARLEHAHIARVYDSGMAHGVYYYAMELVEGGLHLDQYVAENRLSRVKALELMRRVCEAVRHAHQKGVIHRDLKPSNILVSKEGTPKVLDFGVAKEIGDAGDGCGGLTLTLEGQCAGTPAFMAPEQAAARSHEIDTRTDVYGLGATLYLLLTGQTPHDMAGPRHEVLRRLAEDAPRRPRGVDRDLEAVLLTALARDPEQRYESASALARDLDNYVAGRPVTARRPSAVYALRKWVIRNRWKVAATGLAAFISVAGGVVLRRQLVEQWRRGHDEALINLDLADLVHHGRFAEAIVGHDKLLQSATADARTWSANACLYFAAGDADGYKRRCGELLARFGGTADPAAAAAVARACCLTPDAMTDWRPVVALADRAVAAPPAGRGKGADCWRYLAKGMAEYRTGRWEQALPWLNRARTEADRPHCAATACFFSAMAERRLQRGGRKPAAFDEAYMIAATESAADAEWPEGIMMDAARLEALGVLGRAPIPQGRWQYHPRTGPLSLPGLVQAEDFDDGGEGIGYHDVDEGNSGNNLWYRLSDVDLDLNGDFDVGTNVGHTQAGEWLAYTVEVAEGGPYDLELRVAANGYDASLHVEFDGRDVTGPIAVPWTGGAQTYETVVRPAIPLTTGRHVMHVVFDRVGTDWFFVCNLNWIAVRRSDVHIPPAPTTRAGG